MPRFRTVLLGLVAAPLVTGAAAVGAIVATGKHRQTGVTESEVAAALPGDDVFPHASIQNDRGITIAAPPENVWPWIAQIGQNKAGFYSCTALENAIGCDIENASEIREEWQAVEPGDVVPVAPEGNGFTVEQVEPGRHLVLSAVEGVFLPEGMDFRGTWAFVLTTTDGRSTRLHLRERYEALAPNAAGKINAISVASFVMTAKMLRTIKALAERA